ncbi:MAG: tetratricopeptide repeat protein [Nitrospinota bacterium]|nr:tetratricopeptide repeat protein [Nitrospinota bacterium]
MDADERQFETDSSDELRNEALLFLEKGNTCHREGDLEEAIRNYLESIRRFPTADAHTYLGWMYSFQGRIEEAIEECNQAIEVDEDFGNPYNDIGCYLLQIGEEDESVEWFQKAKKASRYDPRHFPFLNMGRIYLKRGAMGKALGEFHRALRFAPKDDYLRRQVNDLVSLLN